jgi:tetratricopeptide (TPR) repeat protein
MKIKLIFLCWLLLLSVGVAAQSDRLCQSALELFHQTKTYQGSFRSQMFFDSLLTICPKLAIVYREKSVPFLKRGDYQTWYHLISKAVDLEPQNYLHIRGWCRIKFLHDYRGGLNDLQRYDSIVKGSYKVVDDTHIKVWMALAMQGLKDYSTALKRLDEALESTISSKGGDWVGLYDYLYRGILKLDMNNIEGAINDFDAQIKLYPKLANAYYYRGIAFSKNGMTNDACTNFEVCLKYFLEGYFIQDPYVRMPGEITYDDISFKLKKCQ